MKVNKFFFMPLTNMTFFQKLHQKLIRNFDLFYFGSKSYSHQPWTWISCHYFIERSSLEPATKMFSTLFKLCSCFLSSLTGSLTYDSSFWRPSITSFERCLIHNLNSSNSLFWMGWLSLRFFITFVFTSTFRRTATQSIDTMSVKLMRFPSMYAPVSSSFTPEPNSSSPLLPSLSFNLPNFFLFANYGVANEPRDPRDPITLQILSTIPHISRLGSDLVEPNSLRNLPITMTRCITHDRPDTLG